MGNKSEFKLSPTESDQLLLLRFRALDYKAAVASSTFQELQRLLHLAASGQVFLESYVVREIDARCKFLKSWRSAS